MNLQSVCFCRKLPIYSDLEANKHSHSLPPFSPPVFSSSPSLSSLASPKGPAKRLASLMIKKDFLSQRFPKSRKTFGNSLGTSIKIQPMTLRKAQCFLQCGSDPGETREKSEGCESLRTKEEHVHFVLVLITLYSGSLYPRANAGAAENVSSIPAGRSPGGGNGNPLQYSCLGNPTDRGAWWAAVHGVAKESGTTEHHQSTSCISSVQFSRSVMSDSLRPHESQHARPPCPSPTPGVH